MKLTRKIALFIAPFAVAATVSGVAVAANAWHTSTNITASGSVGTVKPVTATAVIGDIYPGQPMTYTLTYTNPNSFNVNALALQATDVTFTDAAVYPTPVTTYTEHRSYAPQWAMSPTAFDWSGSQVLTPGTHQVTLTATSPADVTWADALQQGTSVSLTFWVDEAAF